MIRPASEIAEEIVQKMWSNKTGFFWPGADAVTNWIAVAITQERQAAFEAGMKQRVREFTDKEIYEIYKTTGYPFEESEKVPYIRVTDVGFFTSGFRQALKMIQGE